MRSLLIALFSLSILSAQISNMTWGPVQSYSYQFDGSHGFPNNGRFSDQDTTRTTWCDDNKTYLTGNDGLGPQFVLVINVGRTIFLTTMSDFTVASAGVTQTMVNSMDSFGHSAEDVYHNGTSVKSSGILCQNGTLYWATYQQFSATNYQWGSSLNIMKSLDHGATWCNPAHTNHTTGACTITPSATGDIPTVSDSMFDASLKIMHYAQYCKDGIGCPVVERNDVYTYGFVVTEFATHVYASRILTADLKKSDGTLYSYYQGGTCTVDGSWGALGTALPIEPNAYSGAVSDVADALYIPGPNFHTYVTLFGGGGTQSGHAGFYQSQSFCGPYVSLLEFPVSDESWNAPILKSLTVNGNNARINYLTTFGPPEQDVGSPQLNLYNPIFHVATFTGSAKGILRGQAVLAGSTTLK